MLLLSVFSNELPPFLEHNPLYFSDPEEFRPSRWYKQETSDLPDAFTAFSVGAYPHLARLFTSLVAYMHIHEGPRACIGRKFATTEAVCWLTMLLRDFKVEVPFLPDETTEEARNRVLQAQLVMTLQVDPVPIRLVRRTTT